VPDILKVTTPLINKNAPTSPKQAIDPANAFVIQDTAKVIRPQNQSEILKQNTTLLEAGDGSKLLMNLLKDPSVTVTYLKNIFLLEEIFRLLPANNKTVTNEIQQVFRDLVLQPEELAPEMLRQEHESTVFKGELFDFLREISFSSEQEQPELQNAIANFLKAINNIKVQNDIIDAVSNNLTYLKNNMPVAHALAARIETLIRKFKSEGAKENFQSLKAETLHLMKDIEGSFYFSQKFGKIVSIIVYNLSRFNDNPEFFSEAVYRLKRQLPETERSKFAKLLEEFEEEQLPGLVSRPEAIKSKVMEALVKIITNQAQRGAESESEEAKTKAILHSLLSSPCNFTPLLHFILPLSVGRLRAFAELWINQERGDSASSEGAGPTLHFLMVIDVDTVGRFEAEFFVRNKAIDFTLYTPPGCGDSYRAVIEALPGIVARTEYSIGRTELKSLDRTRSLMDVFKSLPYKRVGVDVRI